MASKKEIVKGSIVKNVNGRKRTIAAVCKKNGVVYYKWESGKSKGECNAETLSRWIKR